LAIFCSLSGCRTLVIDADLHQATISRTLAQGAKTSLLDAIADYDRSSEATVSVGPGFFDLLPASGSTSPDSSASFVSDRFQALLLPLDRIPGLLKHLANRYDLVIVDLPAGIADDNVLAFSAMLDNVVLIAEWGQTPSELVADLIRSLQLVSASIAGVVLTKVRRSSRRRNRSLSLQIQSRSWLSTVRSISRSWPLMSAGWQSMWIKADGASSPLVEDWTSRMSDVVSRSNQRTAAPQTGPSAGISTEPRAGRLAP
jgi:Mrp family chromosome partitioning ATPase